MKKHNIMCVLLVCCVIFTMCSCGKTMPQDNTENAVKTVTDSEGNSYTVLTDENGFPVIDEDGRIAITSGSKNETEEYATEKIDYPGILSSEDEIFTRFFNLAIPDKWQNKSDELVRIVYEDGEVSAEMTVNERPSLSMVECVAEIEELTSALDKPEKTVVDLDFATATKLVFMKKMLIYVFSVEERTYFVKFTSDSILTEKINYEEIVNMIKFRKGE